MLQAKLVGILEALGQGIDQQLPAPYVNAQVPSLQPGYNRFGDLPSLPTHTPSSPARLNQALTGPSSSMQPPPTALMSEMMEQFGGFGLNSRNTSVYTGADPGLTYLPKMYPARGGPQMGPPALPPEQIAAWQAAWLQQPLSAALHTYQG